MAVLISLYRILDKGRENSKFYNNFKSPMIYVISLITRFKSSIRSIHFMLIDQKMGKKRKMVKGIIVKEKKKLKFYISIMTLT